MAQNLLLGLKKKVDADASLVEGFTSGNVLSTRRTYSQHTEETFRVRVGFALPLPATCPTHSVQALTLALQGELRGPWKKLIRKEPKSTGHRS